MWDFTQSASRKKVKLEATNYSEITEKQKDDKKSEWALRQGICDMM
jgi:hypothetical protein